LLALNCKLDSFSISNLYCCGVLLQVCQYICGNIVMFKAIYVDFIISDDLHLVLRLRMIGITPTLLHMS